MNKVEHILKRDECAHTLEPVFNSSTIFQSFFFSKEMLRGG